MTSVSFPPPSTPLPQSRLPPREDVLSPSPVRTHSVVPQHAAPQSVQPTPTPNYLLQTSQFSQSSPQSTSAVADFVNSPTSSISSETASFVPSSSHSPTTEISSTTTESPSISQSVSPSASASSAAPTPSFSDTATTQPSLTSTSTASTPASSTSSPPAPSQEPTLSLSSSPLTLTRQPLFIIGIALGSLAIIACLATLIAWFVRTRTHIRRRHQELAADIPWVRPSDNPGLEAGRDATFIGLPIGSRSAWEALSDHDVGEPKRSESYVNHRRQVYGPYLGSDHVLHPTTAPVGSVAYPLPVHHGSYQFTPSPGGGSTLDGHGTAPTLGPLQIYNFMPGDFSAESSPSPSARSPVSLSGDLGTPREDYAGLQPRFLGLEEKGLRVPWNPAQPSDRRSLLHPKESLTRTNVPPINASGGEKDGWTSSLKSNLVNAFNAVAMSLSSSGMQEKEETFTPHPSKQAAGHRPLRSGGRVSSLGLDQSLSRGDSGASKAWTLRDKGNGSGTVHFPGIAGYEDTHSAIDSTNAPLVATTKPKDAFLRSAPLRLFSRSSRGMTSVTRAGIGTRPHSRSSSIYSISSATSSVYHNRTRHPASRPFIPALSRHSTVTVITPGSSLNVTSDSHNRPDVNRLSSAGFSLSSYYLNTNDSASIVTGEKAREEMAVRQAIDERKSRVRKVA